VELIGKAIDDFLVGIKEIYTLLEERKDKEKLRVWIKTNADKITIERIIWPEISKYLHIKTLDIESERPEVLRVPISKIEEEFVEVAFTRDELIDKLLSTLEKDQVDIVRKIFSEVFTLQLLQSLHPDEREAFKKLLELLAKGRKVSPSFVQRAWEFSKVI